MQKITLLFGIIGLMFGAACSLLPEDTDWSAVITGIALSQAIEGSFK